MSRFYYKVIGKEGKIEPYSGWFKSRQEAESWYNKKGAWLEKKFNHKLIFRGNGLQENR